ncbi:hypothetical protein AN936_21795 [Sphingopyxis macrogoltabida]|uniref:Xaa-Pro dipeptidyl-peptidase-like domain-containing protein n=1 Tax=Sphingopyxis macrogoltabida TaxID=33050 RepID=A0A0N9V4V5_SPHMC|nr:hypothetical protein AN936_21795 [Sphingopyxis macrogoltabida]
MRGRGDSEGEFAPFGSEVNDGHDIVDWIAKQPFCNSKVAGNGHGWVGYTQWAAVHSGAKLPTIVPLSLAWVGLDFPIDNNIFYAFAVPWLTHVDGHTQRNTMMKDGAFQVAEQLRFIESRLPFRKMDEFYGIESHQFREWVSHPSQDEYWDRRNPTDEQLAGLTMPVLTMCGHFDGDQPGALEFYRRHQRLSGGKADHYLMLGPWGTIRCASPRPSSSGSRSARAASSTRSGCTPSGSPSRWRTARGPHSCRRRSPIMSWAPTSGAMPIRWAPSPRATMCCIPAPAKIR